jgi:F-type H+-transporting ATPase subunit delta
VFHGDRWAEAFVTVLGENAGAGLECLRAMIPPVKAIPGELFGHTDACRLEKLLRESFAASGLPDDGAVEYAIRFISLLVEKNNFRHVDSVVRRIEQKIDNQNGILDVFAESAAPLDSALAEDLRRNILEQTGAAGIKMKTSVNPALLGGYRLRIGGFHVDASLKGQLDQMTADLTAAAAASAPTGA